MIERLNVQAELDVILVNIKRTTVKTLVSGKDVFARLRRTVAHHRVAFWGSPLAPLGSFELFEPTGLTVKSDWSILNMMDRMFIQLPFKSFPDGCVQ